MAEKLSPHEYKPAKANPFRCEDCPYLRGNPIHRAGLGPIIRGTARPTKLG